MAGWQSHCHRSRKLIPIRNCGWKEGISPSRHIPSDSLVFLPIPSGLSACFGNKFCGVRRISHTFDMLLMLAVSEIQWSCNTSNWVLQFVPVSGHIWKKLLLMAIGSWWRDFKWKWVIVSGEEAVESRVLNSRLSSKWRSTLLWIILCMVTSLWFGHLSWSDGSWIPIIIHDEMCSLALDSFSFLDVATSMRIPDQATVLHMWAN